MPFLNSYDDDYLDPSKMPSKELEKMVSDYKDLKSDLLNNTIKVDQWVCESNSLPSKIPTMAYFNNSDRWGDKVINKFKNLGIKYQGDDSNFAMGCKSSKENRYADYLIFSEPPNAKIYVDDKIKFSGLYLGSNNKTHYYFVNNYTSK